MTKLQFTPGDFTFSFDDGTNISCFADVLAKHANARLAEMLASAKVVYGTTERGLNWTISKGYTDTHRALLINIEEIKKECMHEGVSKYFVDMSFSHFECKHCGKKLKARWEAEEVHANV